MDTPRPGSIEMKKWSLLIGLPMFEEVRGVPQEGSKGTNHGWFR